MDRWFIGVDAFLVQLATILSLSKWSQIQAVFVLNHFGIYEHVNVLVVETFLGVLCMQCNHIRLVKKVLQTTYLWNKCKDQQDLGDRTT